MDPAPAGKLVLIVEDEFDNREIMRAVVEDLLGYKALAAGDGVAALRAVEEQKPDLILMDLMMPVLDGFDTIRILKARAETRNIPVLAVTALSRPVDRDRALAEGAVDYLCKPFDIEALAKAIEQHVQGEVAESA
ncbi:MAG TPA: response regulator [Chloroflexia bacterium]|nr:response regulator [Chloroflexia bacterium]